MWDIRQLLSVLPGSELLYEVNRKHTDVNGRVNDRVTEIFYTGGWQASREALNWLLFLS